MEYQEHVNQDVRLIILKALHEQDDYALNSSILQALLESYGHTESRSYIHNQLRWMERNVQAVKLTEAGSILVATLTSAGRDHVERRARLEGIKRPSPEV
ncbi:hypothetical protein PUV47_01355 [Pseudovibrio exalbescens]|uniref:VpaChn25_0724 family phage protein n=1 Tax=Pseudovibrio exalbescens TaxID=197461 RepID=UPI002365B2F6|nr:hypothetical protein [Pseudovibrio exalbescens]MDD7908548.1 hypothetical protein [Pseudovibrio exalbescens]